MVGLQKSRKSSSIKVRSFCETSFSLLSPSVMLVKIEFIYYKSDMAGRMIEEDPLKQAFRTEKDRLR